MAKKKSKVVKNKISPYNKNVLWGSFLFAFALNVFGLLYVCLTKRFDDDKLAAGYKTLGLALGMIISTAIWAMIVVAFLGKIL